jgi:hypothetical protein
MARSPKKSEVTPKTTLQSRVVRETVVAPKKGRRTAARTADAPPEVTEATVLAAPARVKRTRVRTPKAAAAAEALPAVNVPDDETVRRARLEQIRTRASRIQGRPRTRAQAEESVEAKIAAIAAASAWDPDLAVAPAEAPPTTFDSPAPVAASETTEPALVLAATEPAVAPDATEVVLASTEPAPALVTTEAAVAPEAILEETPLAGPERAREPGYHNDRLLAPEPPAPMAEAPAVLASAPPPAAPAAPEPTAPTPVSWQPPAEARPPEPSADPHPVPLPIADPPAWLAQVPRRVPPPRPTQRRAPTVLTPVRWVVSRLLRWAGL